MAEFTHLHVHTGYSLLDGAGKINEMVSRAKELGMDSLAITDHGVMFGVIDFYEACKKEGIKAIIGCEVYVSPISRFDKKNSNESRYNHLILLAENEQGYNNLIKIVSIGYLEGFYYKPRVDYEILEKYHEGIIAASACLAGEVQRSLLLKQYDEAKEAALRLQDIFGKGNFFLELQDHGYSEQKYVNSYLIQMSKETGIDLICTNDVHYIKAEDADAHDVLLCIQTGKKVSDENRMRYSGGQFYLKSQEEMKELFAYVPEAISNTQKIANRCNLEIEFGHTKLPKYDYPSEFNSAWEYLYFLCEEGLTKKYELDKEENIEKEKELKKRLNDELEVIHNMGYVDYFLIVWDYVNYAKEHDIPVGPGRGSAAGSIVSYSLGITDLDPIKYNLIFERFLNPERVSMPDIDIDFCYERRGEVIDYVIRKYGKECVSQIITFGTLAARAAIKDVGRVLDIPYASVDEVAKMIPQTLGITIDKAIELNSDLKQVYKDDSQMRDLIDKARRLEGLPRHASVHAAGVLICDRPIDEYVPVSLGANAETVASFDMITLERLGLLKMDFLGLRTLTVIKDAVNLIKKKDKDFDIDKIDVEDSKVYDYIATGKCDGIFQLESAGMKSFMKELKATNIEDLIAGISLYRPGPMDFIPKYIEGKNNKDNIKYLCKELEPILESTYGCIVYQEQVMQIVRDLAGYSWGRSDIVRRAMSKKHKDEIERERHNFIYGIEEEGVAGCIKNGISEEVAGKIYDSILDFANYAFNKSHAACYAVISYQTAFLKCYYPVEFMAALMTSVIDNSSKVAAYIYDCKQIGIDILPPDINKSIGSFSVEDGAIRYGLNAIKSVGRPSIKEIEEDRKIGGAFRNLNDFIARMNAVMNKRNLDNMIKAGAFDWTGQSRRAMTTAAPEILANAIKKSKDELSGQMSIVDFFATGNHSSEKEMASFLEVDIKDMEEFSHKEILDLEKEVLGLYVSGHPLDDVMDIWEKTSTAVSKDFLQNEGEEGLEVSTVEDGKTYTVGGLLVASRIITTKKGSLMAFLTIEDPFGTLEVIVFPKQYEEARTLLTEGNKIFVRGQAGVDASGEAKLLASRVFSFDDDILTSKPVLKTLWLQFADKESYLSNKADIYQLITSQAKKDKLCANKVKVYCKAEKVMDIWKEDLAIDIDLVTALKKIYGEENIALSDR